MRAYHGLTLAAMSATGLPAFWPMFEPRTPGFLHIDAPDPVSVRAPTIPASALASRRRTSSKRRSCAKAPTPSPRSSPNPCRAPAASSFRRLTTSRAFARSAIGTTCCSSADEVITGFGRTGRWFGLEHYGVEPDIMQFAKGITSGYIPLGGIGVSDAVREVINSVPPGEALDACLHLLWPSDVLRRGAGEHRHHRARGAGRARAPTPARRLLERLANARVGRRRRPRARLRV